jgi:hypothetical protein
LFWASTTPAKQVIPPPLRLRFRFRSFLNSLLYLAKYQLTLFGQTAIVHHLKGEQEYESIPTVGFNVETIKLKNIALNVWVRAHPSFFRRASFASPDTPRDLFSEPRRDVAFIPLRTCWDRTWAAKTRSDLSGDTTSWALVSSSSHLNMCWWWWW